MYINNAWLPQLVWETPTEGTSGTPTIPSGDDTTPGGDDTAPAASSDLLSGDDTAPGGDDTAPGDLLSGDDTTEGATFGADEIGIDDFKASFTNEDGTPQEIEWDDEKLTGFLDIVNGAESRADMAKQILSLYETETQASADAMAAQFQKTIDTWKQEVRDDRHLGGDKLEATLATVKTFIETHSANPKATLAAFKATGIGNSIHLIQLLHAAAGAVPGEASPAEGAPVPTGKSMADRLFGS